MLEQGTVCTMSTGSRSSLGQIRGQVAAGQEGRAEGEGRLQTPILLGRGHLQKKKNTRWWLHSAYTESQFAQTSLRLTLEAAVAVAVAGSPRVMLGKDGEV